MKNKKSQTKLITGISIIAFGSLGSLFLGLGIAFNDPTLSWIGGIIMATIPFILAIASKWLI